jgi:hypothetical protein
MFYYKVESSHWKNTMEFKSTIPLTEGQCFRITGHNGLREYPTRLKVVSISDTPEFTGNIIEITSVDTEVEAF